MSHTIFVRCPTGTVQKRGVVGQSYGTRWDIPRLRTHVLGHVPLVNRNVLNTLSL